MDITTEKGVQSLLWRHTVSFWDVDSKGEVHSMSFWVVLVRCVDQRVVLVGHVDKRGDFVVRLGRFGPSIRRKGFVRRPFGSFWSVASPKESVWSDMSTKRVKFGVRLCRFGPLSRRKGSV